MPYTTDQNGTHKLVLTQVGEIFMCRLNNPWVLAMPPARRTVELIPLTCGICITRLALMRANTLEFTEAGFAQLLALLGEK